ncbi:integrin alpha-PS1-like isoform X2 [Daphnia pulex]|uniref:integrin alpha-PS1-like isoform X2 n=1 Tax=Daphnia pulex TaxID=6669 RepID=UPI001EDE4D87|nr:integrin alpha-PS1-like isoform X2 [Daphnia pulex]XP_046437436.1 integrin alpha-PS1-like isoform X2 [Daphnia pulex]XP_046632321.1 integrin alpha-PS1-like isoform X2 [Daphnia pulicaria]
MIVQCVNLFLLLATSANGFNLEPRIPVMKNGMAGSYFGYSVAQHQSVSAETGAILNNWLLVGAPLDQNLQPGTNRSGALWRCPMTTRKDDCVQVVTDGKRNIRSNQLVPPLPDEIKDGQWLGVTVRSQGPGRKVLVCAHRYIRKGADYQWGQGLCYTLTQNLDYDETWEPCRGRPTTWAHEQFGYCQAGTSGMLLDDDTALIGTPGPYTWRGTVFAVSVSDDFLHRDKTLYYGPLTQDHSPVDKYSYLGMSVTSGKYFGSKVSYAAGAPRSNGTGQVVIFTKVKKAESQLRVQLVLSGEQFASSYGYQIATADLNGDSRADLIVGAPFYYDREAGGAVYVYSNPPDGGLTADTPYVKLVGKPESRFGFALANLGDINKDRYEDLAVGAPYEGKGVVYIYLGSKHGIITEPSQILKAEDIPGIPPTTFGYSLSGGLDMDLNDYPDLMVGAYEDDRVFLIRSRPIIGILTRVQPEENLKNIDPNTPGCEKYPNSTEVCFSFNACFAMDSMEGYLRANDLELKYRIEAETFSGRKFSRVHFAHGLAEKPHVVERNIQLRGVRNGTEQCFVETAFVKEGTRDIQSAVKFRMGYTLVQREPRSPRDGDPLPNINQYPILNQQEASKTFQATFEKDCGDNDVCESNMVTVANLDLPQGEDGVSILELGELQEVVLDISVTNTGESAYEAGLYVSHPRSLSFIGRVSEANQLLCNSFNATMVTCSLGNPFKHGSGYVKLRFNPSNVEDSEARLAFLIFTNTTSQELEPQGNIPVYANVVKRAEISIKGLGRPEQVFFGGEVQSTIKYRDEIGQPLLHSYEIYNAGPWKVPFLSVIVSWPYQVENGKPIGKWLLYMDETPKVDGDGECIMDPKQVNVLDLPKRPGFVEAPIEHLARHLPVPTISDIDENEIVEMESAPVNSTRQKRQAGVVILPEAIVDNEGKTRHVVTMDCDRGTAKCFMFRCNIRNLQRKQSAVIKIRARLWNATLVEDFPGIHTVRIRSKAHISLDPSLEITQRIEDDLDYAETMAYPDRLDTGESPSVPLWIIIVSVLAGILLLVLLILLLWRLGFFKRKRPDPTLKGSLLQKDKELNGEYIS